MLVGNQIGPFPQVKFHKDVGRATLNSVKKNIDETSVGPNDKGVNSVWSVNRLRLSRGVYSSCFRSANDAPMTKHKREEDKWHPGRRLGEYTSALNGVSNPIPALHGNTKKMFAAKTWARGKVGLEH